MVTKKLPRYNRFKEGEKMSSKIKPWDWSEFGVSNIDKTQLTSYYYKMLLNRVINMFTWENLPETIKPRYIEKSLFHFGKAIFVDDDNLGLICVPCEFAEEMNVNFEHTKVITSGYNYIKTIPYLNKKWMICNPFYYHIS